MKKILFMTLAAILVLSVALVGCAGGGGGGAVAPSAIKIGLVRDTDGVLQFYDQTSGGPVYRAINKTINDAGGIFMSTYNKSLPLELIIREYDPMTPAELGSQTIASITVDKVHFMWGAPGTGTIYVQAPICDAYGMLLMTLEGGATDMMSVPGKLDSWANTFINLSFSDWYQIPVMYKMLKEHVAAPRAYVLYIDNEHGAEYLNVTKQIFGAGNVTAEGHHQYIATQSDIDTIVTNAISALNTTGFEVFCAYTYDPYLSWTVASMNAYDFDPPAILMGPGAESGAYLYQFGGNLTGVCGFAVANNKSSVAPESVTMSFSAMWSLTMPQNSDPALPDKYCWTPWGQPPMFAGLEMFAEAVKQVGHLGVGYTAAVRSVLVGFNSTNPCTTILGDTWYHVLGGGLGGGVIDYQCMPAQICQWQNNYTEIVGYTNITNDIPKYDVTSSFWYPMTGNWTWLP